VLAYDAVMALAAALERVGPVADRGLAGDLRPLRARVRDALAEVEIEGEAGAVRFDEHGDSQRSVAIMRTSRDPDGVRRTRLVRLLRGP
jgi:ABC-type branched-subunit amino acid transport system substrate-binding protein